MRSTQPIVIVFVLLIASTLCHGGWSSDSKSAYPYRHDFKYDMNGEIEIKPDRAHLPITIRTVGASNVKALNKSKVVLKDLQNNLVKIKMPYFVVSPADFFEPREYSKKISLSFFKKDEETSTSHLNLFFSIKFVQSDDFWIRANKVAEALDFIFKISMKYKEREDVRITSGSMFYEIHNKEQYRERIIQSIHTKAKKVVDVIAKNEGKKPVVKEIRFSQHIKDDIPNFNQALLSIDATLEYNFE